MTADVAAQGCPVYEGASPTGLTMRVTCGNRGWGRSLTAKVTAKW